MAESELGVLATQYLDRRIHSKDGHLVGTQETQPWPEGFTENDGGIVEDLGKDGVLYKINYDNAYHMKYRLGARSFEHSAVLGVLSGNGKNRTLRPKLKAGLLKTIVCENCN